VLASKRNRRCVRKLALSRKEDEKTKRKEQEDIEIELKKEERRIPIYLAHMFVCVWLQIDLKQQQKESTGSWGKPTRD